MMRLKREGKKKTLVRSIVPHQLREGVEDTHSQIRTKSGSENCERGESSNPILVRKERKKKERGETHFVGEKGRKPSQYEAAEFDVLPIECIGDGRIEPHQQPLESRDRSRQSDRGSQPIRECPRSRLREIIERRHVEILQLRDE